MTAYRSMFQDNPQSPQLPVLSDHGVARIKSTTYGQGSHSIRSDGILGTRWPSSVPKGKNQVGWHLGTSDYTPQDHTRHPIQEPETSDPDYIDVSLSHNVVVPHLTECMQNFSVLF